MTQPSPEQIRQREALILGKPLRIQPVTDLTDEMRALLALPPGMDKAPVNTSPAINVGPSMTEITMHNLELARRWWALMPFFLSQGTLSHRDRELATLRTAWLRQVPFIWGEHVTIGKRIGLTAEEVERVTEGSGAPGWSEHDRAIIRAVEELIDEAMISDPTWEVLAKTLSEAQLIELPLLIGCYQALGYFQNSLRFPLRKENPGLTAR